MSTSTELDVWLLAQDWTVPFTHSNLPSLSPSQLAVAALRNDVDPVLSKWAFHHFLTQRVEYQRSDKVPVKPLFDLPLDVPLPPPPVDLSLFSPSDLILLQFNPTCTGELARRAGEAFLALSSRGRRTDPPTQGKEREKEKKRWSVKVEKYRVEGAGGEWTAEEGDVRVVVEEKGLRAMRGDEVVGEIDASDVVKYTYLAGASSPLSLSEGMDTTLLLHLIDGTTTVFLSFGMVERADPAFKAFRKAVKRWSREWGREVKVERTVPVPAMKKKHSKPSVFPNGPTSPSSPSQTVFSPAPLPTTTPPSSPPTPTQAQCYSPPLPPVKTLSDSIWDLVGDEPQSVEWLPGFYARQYALIESIDPFTTSLDSAPSFTDEELALLSFKPRFRSLPRPPPEEEIPLEVRSARGHAPASRLAMERIYKSRGYGWLGLKQTRHLLLSLSPSLAPLQAYAQIVAKLILARDTVRSAYRAVLEERLIPRLGLKNNLDPVENLVRLVEGLEEDRDYYRSTWFATRDKRTLITRSTFTSTQIGGGPSRRFKEKLADIVAYEEQVWERFGRRKRGDG